MYLCYSDTFHRKCLQLWRAPEQRSVCSPQESTRGRPLYCPLHFCAISLRSSARYKWSFPWVTSMMANACGHTRSERLITEEVSSKSLCPWWRVRLKSYLLEETDTHWVPVHHHVQATHLQIDGRDVQGERRIQLAGVSMQKYELKQIKVNNKIKLT